MLINDISFDLKHNDDFITQADAFNLLKREEKKMKNQSQVSSQK